MPLVAALPALAALAGTMDTKRATAQVSGRLDLTRLTITDVWPAHHVDLWAATSSARTCCPFTPPTVCDMVPG